MSKTSWHKTYPLGRTKAGAAVKAIREARRKLMDAWRAVQRMKESL